MKSAASDVVLHFGHFQNPARGGDAVDGDDAVGGDVVVVVEVVVVCSCYDGLRAK